MIHDKLPLRWKTVFAAGALLSLSGCMYGEGYYGDGYVNNSYSNGGYGCDPYAPFDDYYACDSGYGFANIGFGGGWYDQFYYPGYGVYLFDRAGRRHAMRDHHRRHWAKQRAQFGGKQARSRYQNSERRAERRNYRAGNDEGSRDQRRGRYRNQDGTGVDRANRRANRAARTDRGDQATSDRRRSNRADRVNRRPTMAVDQPQARPVPNAKPQRVERQRSSSKLESSRRRREQDK